MVAPSRDLDTAFTLAVSVAVEFNHEYITVEHVLYALLVNDQFSKSIDEFGANSSKLKKEIFRHLETKCDDIISSVDDVKKPKKTAAFDRILNKTFTQVIFDNRQTAEIVDVFCMILNETHSWAVYYLADYDIEKGKFIEYINKNMPNASRENDPKAEKALLTYADNLNEHAKKNKLTPVIGRVSELENIALVLGRKNKNNLILAGAAGCGKSAIVEGLAYNIIKGKVPDFLKDYTVYSLDIAAMLAGAKYRGDFEERFKLVMKALDGKGKTVLFIDEAHMMTGAGSSTTSSIDLANLLKPALSRGNIKVIAATTWEEYRKHFEKDKALVRRFQLISVDEPTPEVTLKILKGIKKYYEKHHDVKINECALKEAIKLSVKYQTDKRLPDKAIDLIDCACSRFNLTNNDIRTVSAAQIQFELSKMVKMPVEQIMETESNNLSTLHERLSKEVYGQDTALDDIVDKIMVSHAGLKAENKPVGSFVFVGPSGCGKSSCAISLANHLGTKLIRIDGSEYQEKHSISKLIGSPPGYVGYEDNAGLLITQIQENPNAVLLFDEIEKSHPDVSTILLQIMDNGFVTGSNGKQADCRNIVLIMTTNAGAQDAEKNNIGFGKSEKVLDDSALKLFFSPEFRNRLDGIITFNKLDKTTLVKVVHKFIDELRVQVKPKLVKLKITNPAVDWLIDKGFDHKMGARPMHRIIDKEIKRSLAKMMLFGDLKTGGTLTISVNDDKITLDAIGISDSKVKEKVCV